MAKVVEPFKNHPLFKKSKNTLEFSRIKNPKGKETHTVKAKRLK